MPPRRATQRRPARRPAEAPKGPARAESADGGIGAHRAGPVEAKGGPQLLWLYINEIIVPKQRIRSRFRGDEDAALEASIEAVNIQSPLGVKRVEGSYVLDDGENRLRIAIEKGINPVPCVVTEGTMRDVIRANASSLNKGTPNPRELMATLAAWNREDGIEIGELAKWLGRSEEWVEEMLTAEEALSDAVKDMLGEEIIRLGHALLLAREDQGEQDRVLHLVIDKGWSIDELRTYLAGGADDPEEPPARVERAPAPRSPRVCTLCHKEQTRGTIQTMHICDGCAATKLAPGGDGGGGAPGTPSVEGDAALGELVMRARAATPELWKARELLTRMPGGARVAESVAELARLLEGGKAGEVVGG